MPVEIRNIKFDTRILDKFRDIHGWDIDGALRSVAFSVEGYAKAEAPVDTGALKNSIFSEKESDLSYIISDSVEYGIYVELGTSKMAAQPFLIPALERVVSIIEEEVKKAIEKAT